MLNSVTKSELRSKSLKSKITAKLNAKMEAMIPMHFESIKPAWAVNLTMAGDVYLPNSTSLTMAYESKVDST